MKPRLVLAMTAAILAALSLLIVVGASHAVDYSLMGDIVGRSSLERCYRRCEKNNPPAPSPEPTRTPAPLPCEPFDSAVTRDFSDGQQRMLCFDVKGAGPAVVTVASQNHGNASCADAEATLTSPSGRTAYSNGTQIGGALMRETGRWYFWAHLFSASNLPGCHTYTFTVTK